MQVPKEIMHCVVTPGERVVKDSGKKIKKSVMGVRSIASLVQSGLPLGLVVFRDINLNRPFSCYADYMGTAVLDTSGFSPQ